MKSRQDQIVDDLTSKGEVYVHDLAKRFGVSVMTIRRDLVLLEKEGKLTRTYGGAVISNAGIIEFSFKEKEKDCKNSVKINRARYAHHIGYRNDNT
jgi:DeoR/GlpR family transcriptional regulator of sugar metabolism